MKKVLRGTPKHLSSKGSLEGFSYLMLTLPFKCNYRCPKCFNLVNDQPTTSGEAISLEAVLQKIHEARDLGGRSVVIAGEGEPTLDGNIFEIVSAIDDLGMVPVIYSNGSSLVPDVAEFYRSRNASLVIAIDSLKPSVYRTVTGTGPNMLEVVLRNLGRLREIFSSTVEELEGQRLVRLALNMTVSSINWDEIEEIKAFAGDDFYFVCNPLARQGNAVGHWPVLMTGDSRELELVQELVQKYSESGGPLTFDGRGLCGYSVNGIGIGPYGHYMTCAYTTRTNGLLGTIRERSLGAAYAIKNAKELSHYQVFGQMPCLVRSASFESFADGLSEHGPAEISRKQQHIMEKSTGSRLVVIR